MEEFINLIDSLKANNISNTTNDDLSTQNALTLVSDLFQQQHHRAYTPDDFMTFATTRVIASDCDYLISMLTVLGMSLAYNVYLQELITNGNALYSINKKGHSIEI